MFLMLASSISMQVAGSVAAPYKTQSSPRRRGSAEGIGHAKDIVGKAASTEDPRRKRPVAGTGAPVASRCGSRNQP
jgi:hypothetical protein